MGYDTHKTYKIQSLESDKFLTVQDTSEYSKVIQSDWTGADSQKWKFLPIGEYYEIYSIQNANMRCDIEYASKEKGAPLIYYPVNEHDNQKWKIEWQDDIAGKCVAITCKKSGKVLDVPSHSAGDVQIIQWDWHKGANQQWVITELD